MPSTAPATGAAALAQEQRVSFYRRLVDAIGAGWDGDRDTLEASPAPEDWIPVAAERHTCTVKACPQFDDCAYYRARRRLADVDVIVANHDLLLASPACQGHSPARGKERPHHDAQRAHEMGAVNAVVPHAELESTALQWAKEINAKSPTAQRMLKFSFNLIDDGLVGQQVFAGEATRLAYMTDEAEEGRNAFLEKRDPNWDDYPWHF